MILERPYLVIISLVVFIPIAFGVTYLISVGNEFIAPFFPYISDTGAFPPSSCIFGQCLDIGAFFLIYITYVRYLHIKEFAKDQRLIRLNNISLYLGFAAAVGITVVGNFQESTVYVVHMIGALTAFCCYIIYLFIDTYLTKSLSDFMHGSLKLSIFRLVVCIIAAINLTLVIVFTNVASAKFEGPDFYFWTSEDGGYISHIIATSNEWCMSLMIVIMIATFFGDFRNVKVNSPQLTILAHGSKVMDPETIGIGNDFY